MLLIGGLLLLFGAIGLNTDIAFGGILRWTLMVAGVVVMLVGVTKKNEHSIF